MNKTYSFTPSQSEGSRFIVPYFEDAKASIAPYYSTHMKVVSAMELVIKELSKLGGAQPHFIEGTFKIAGQTRYGYEIRFLYGGLPAEMVVAGLPMRAIETQIKRNRVLAQALLIVRDQLKAAISGKIFAPTSDPLMQYLLIEDGSQTVAQAMHQSGRFPQLMMPAIDGEIVE